jgi:hypothetical protein
MITFDDFLTLFADVYICLFRSQEQTYCWRFAGFYFWGMVMWMGYRTTWVCLWTYARQSWDLLMILDVWWLSCMHYIRHFDVRGSCVCILREDQRLLLNA